MQTFKSYMEEIVLGFEQWDDKTLTITHKSWKRAKDMNSRMMNLFKKSSKEMKKRGLKV